MVNTFNEYYKIYWVILLESRKSEKFCILISLVLCGVNTCPRKGTLPWTLTTLSSGGDCTVVRDLCEEEAGW